MNTFLSVLKLTFAYPSALAPLFENISFQLQPGWTGIVGANGSGKTTLLKLLCGLLQPDSGSITPNCISYYCEQRTDIAPEHGMEFINSYDKSSYSIKEKLQIEDDWLERWDSLSHGERKRCQIGAALYFASDLLALDEPSNHLDGRSRAILIDALEHYRGIGVLVSHDRQLLDELCAQTLFVLPPLIDLRKCSYTVAEEEREKELIAQQHAYDTLKQQAKHLSAQVQAQKAKTQRVDKQRSKKHISPMDHDAKAKIDLGRLTGKDGVQGRIYGRLKMKLERIETQKKSIKRKKQPPIGITMPTAESVCSKTIIIPAMTIQLGGVNKLISPELTIPPGDKIGIIGDNGSGKSTFIQCVYQQIAQRKKRLVYIPQEISVSQSRQMLGAIRNHSSAEIGMLMTLISRLGSEPERLLQTELPTPGEVRKLMLAEGIMNHPEMIIMDEPTNHLDLPSMVCFENVLQSCECSVLLVSHDFVFLQKTADIFWCFTRRDEKTIAIQRLADLTDRRLDMRYIE